MRTKKDELFDEMRVALIAENEALRATELFMVGHGFNSEDLTKTIGTADELLDRVDEFLQEN